MGFLYQNVTGETQESIQDVQGIFFILTCEIVFSTLYRILNFYMHNLPLLRRETHERIYSLSAYYVAECLCDAPFLSIKPMIGLIFTYALAGFDKGLLLFFEIWLTLAFLAFTSNAYGLMLAGVFRSVILEVPPVFNLFFTAVSGIYASLRDYPILKYTSLFFYANEALNIFFWHDIAEIGKSHNVVWNSIKSITMTVHHFHLNTNRMRQRWFVLKKWNRSVG